MREGSRATASLLLLGLAIGCRGGGDGRTVLTFPGSTVGAEGRVLQAQIRAFEAAHPDVRVEIQRTPDDATQRHQLFAQRLNARSTDPDVLQLDVVWTPEFAAAGWLLPLDRFGPDTAAFFPATVRADSWKGRLYALPWWVDAGMLYWRTDLLDAAPATFDDLLVDARRGIDAGAPRGWVWQGARYEGLVTVFLEVLGGYGGRILTDDQRVVVDSPEGIRALTFLRDAIRAGASPEEVLTWHEEETRFAFQNGTAALMRNWPYAYALLGGADSKVAGRFAVAPMPAAPGGRATAALGGSQLGINARSDAPQAAWELIRFLTSPERMLERARAAGELPARPALFDDPRLADALSMPVDQARAVVESATPRPVTPIYSQLSEILQIALHRALVGQRSPAEALHEAAGEMRRTIEETGVRRPAEP